MLGAIKLRSFAKKKLHLKLNFGGTGGAPTNSGWINIWGEPYVDANLNTDVDFGNIGYGIGLRCINDGAPNAWGELGNSALGTFGETSGIYPSTVMQNYWFTSNRNGKVELYNHTGTPLNSKTWTLKFFGSRSNSGGATGPRRSKYSVNGGSETSVESFQNTSNQATFTGVSPSSGIIYFNVNFTVGDQFAYLNAMELIEE